VYDYVGPEGSVIVLKGELVLPEMDRGTDRISGATKRRKQAHIALWPL
jgi:hypothetical protein